MSETNPTVKPARHWSKPIIEIAAAFLIVMAAKGALAEPFYVPSGSMEPTLLIGDALVASKYPYGYSSASIPLNMALPSTPRLFGSLPDRGDVVVFRWPGDNIQMRHGRLWINGQATALRDDGMGRAEDEEGAGFPAARYIETLPGGHDHTIFKMRTHGALDDTPEVVVPKGHLFVMGDNRDNSADSRVPVAEGGVGMLPVDNLVGRVDAIVGSWDVAAKHRPMWDWLSGLRLARSFTTVH